MIDEQVIKDALQVPDGHVDTPEQAQLRECLTAVVTGHSAVDTIRICHDLITVMRDQMSTAIATIRRQATLAAHENNMTRAEIAAGSRQSLATIARLLNESRTNI